MRWLSWVVIILLCLAVAAGLGWFKYSQIQAGIERGKSFPEPAEAVEPYLVRLDTLRPTIEVTGEVIATRSAILRNELQGRIVRVGFEPGAQVKAGDVLLQLDVTQERAQLEEARASETIAALAIERAQRLVRSGAGSVEARDQARAQYEAAQARVEALVAVIDKKTLRAPFDARTGLHQLESGQYLDAGTDITRLVGISQNIWIDFAIPQSDAQLQVGGEVQIRLRGRDDLLPALVIARDAAINVRSRNLRLRAELSAGKADVLPGMLVSVVVPLGEARPVAVVPATAVRRDALGSSVYVLEDVQEQGQSRVRVRQRRVVLDQVRGGSGAGEMVVVTEGLEAGETIAAIGAFKLRDGALVVPGAPEPDAQQRLVGH